jgi:hypothetical protein
MIGHKLFFKKPEMMVTGDTQMRLRDVPRTAVEKRIRHNNQGAREIVGHPRFGFQTILNQDSPVPLPTAPAIVGGNIDWSKAKITPATQYLHSVLSGGRPMNPAPALGSALKLTEPTVHSIHTHY